MGRKITKFSTISKLVVDYGFEDALTCRKVSVIGRSNRGLAEPLFYERRHPVAIRSWGPVSIIPCGRQT